MSGSRARNLLALGLFLVSLWGAVHFARIYAAHRLYLGLLCSLALLGLLGSGGFSFHAARRRRLRELAAFHGAGVPGSLLQRRRAQLAEVARRGGRPDMGALQQQAQAELAGGAYFGRYFVAVAVLVGLLGTFAGLMETLAGVADLLQREGGQSVRDLATLLAAPLLGLDVTFGASMVGILATVTLALQKGDLDLLDEELLAALEEHTAHRLLPELWPAEKEPAARLLAEVAALRGDLSGAATRLEERSRGALAEQQARAAESLDEQARRAAEAVAGLAQALRRADEEREQARQALFRSLCEALRGDIGRETAGLVQRLEEHARREQAQVLAGSAASLSQVVERVAAYAETLRHAEEGRRADHAELRERLRLLIEEGIAAPVAEHLRAWQEAAAAGREAAGEARRSAAALAEAARHFGTASAALLPELQVLAPELQALSAELALLSARGAAPEREERGAEHERPAAEAG